MTKWTKDNFIECTGCNNLIAISHTDCPHCERKNKRNGDVLIALSQHTPIKLKWRGKGKWLYMGKKFDSKDEALRYGYLIGLQEQGIIRHLHIQPTKILRPAFKLTQTYSVKRKDGKPRTIPAETYTPDYAYIFNGNLIIEDVKGLKKGKPYSKANSDRSQKHLMYHCASKPHISFLLVTQQQGHWRYWQATKSYPEVDSPFEAISKEKSA